MCVFKGLNLSSCICSFGFSGKRKKIEHQAGADFLPSTRPPLVTVTSHSKVFLSSKCKALSPWASKKKRKPLVEVALVAADNISASRTNLYIHCSGTIFTS